MRTRAIRTLLLMLICCILATTVSFAGTGAFSHEQYIAKVKQSGINTTKNLSNFTTSEVSTMANLIEKRFVDVSTTDWYANDLAVLATKGIVSGSTLEKGAKFNGTSNVTRAELVTMLALSESTSPDNLKKKKLTANEFAYSVLGVTPSTATYNQKKSVDSALKGSNNISSVATEWYAPYLASLRLKSWGYVRYNKEYMAKPMTRGEVVYLLSETFLINELTTSVMNDMYGVTYFTDIPDTVSLFRSNGDLYTKNKSEYDKEIGITGLLTTYYPKFEDIKSGNQKLPVKVKQAINIANYLGVSVGDGRNTSNWDSYITKAEAVAMIVRTLHKDSRAPQEKRAIKK